MEIIEKNNDSKSIKFTNDELGFLQNALNEVLNGPDKIEDWELHSRIGADKQELEKFLKDLNDL